MSRQGDPTHWETVSNTQLIVGIVLLLVGGWLSMQAMEAPSWISFVIAVTPLVIGGSLAFPQILNFREIFSGLVGLGERVIDKFLKDAPSDDK